MIPEREALRAVWSHKGAWLMFALTGFVFAALAVAWFWIPDARSAAVALSAVSVLAVGSALLCWLGATFSYYRQAHQTGAPRLTEAAGSAVRHLPPLWLWLAVAAWSAWVTHPGVLILLAPFAAAIAVKGWSGFLSPGWHFRYLPSFVFVAGVCGALAWGLWLWRPVHGGLHAEAVSFAARAGVGYMLGISGWLYLASLLGRLQAESLAPSN